jgi:hypothetical protein
MAQALEDRWGAVMSGPTNKEIYAAVMARDLAERATRQQEPSAAKHTAGASAADAKLVAAAPDMAKALQEIASIVSSRGPLSEAKLCAGDLMRIDDLIGDALEKAGL